MKCHFLTLVACCLAVLFTIGIIPVLCQTEPTAPNTDADGVKEVQAQAADEETPEVEVEVVGKREGLLSISPSPGEEAEEITRQEIKDTGATQVLDAIQFTPSVSIRSQGARYEQRLTIRGVSPRLVLLDGIPISREGYSGAGALESGFAGRILYTLPPEIIERIDIIRNAGTIIYGSTTSAGAIINIVTRKPQPTTVWLDAEGGSYDRLRYGLTGTSFDDKTGLGYILDVRRDTASSNLELGNKAFTDAFFKITKDFTDGSKLLLEYFNLDGRRRLDLSDDFAIVPARYWEIDPWQEQFLNLVYSKALGERRTLDLVLYNRDRDFTTNLFSTVSFRTLQRYWEESEDDRGADLRYSARGLRGDLLRMGLQYGENESDVLDIRYGKKIVTVKTADDRVTRSAFANYIYPLRPNLRLSAGLRYDDPDDYEAATTYSAGIDYDLTAHTQLHAHYGYGVGFPIPTPGDITRHVVLPKERSNSIDVGWTLRPNDNTVGEIAFFWSKTKDGTVLYNDPPGSIGPDAWYSKVEDITTSGIELLYQKRWSWGEWFANYTYLDREVTNHNAPLIPGPSYPRLESPPRHLAASGIRWQHGATRYALSAKWSDSYQAQSRLMATAYPVDPFLVLDLTARHRLGEGELWLTVDNLFNTNYETMPAFPRPGRNYLVGYRQAFH
jgi:outer membrane receptor protein involved in Fe transport